MHDSEGPAHDDYDCGDYGIISKLWMNVAIVKIRPKRTDDYYDAFSSYLIKSNLRVIWTTSTTWFELENTHFGKCSLSHDL